MKSTYFDSIRNAELEQDAPSQVKIALDEDDNRTIGYYEQHNSKLSVNDIIKLIVEEARLLKN